MILNQIIHLRLDDEQMEDLWMHVCKGASVIPKWDTKICGTKLQPNLTEKFKGSFAQNGTNNWRAARVRSLVLLHLLT